jgi:signal transduction histidine kinase
VLINLIENARDALAGAATKRLRVGVGREDGRVVLTVADSGPGIAPDALGQVFEPFFSTKPSGTGLGLAIAKRTIDAHGGGIEATSTLGEGATFRVSLPIAAPADGPAPMRGASG